MEETDFQIDLTLLDALMVYFEYGLDPGGCGRAVLLGDEPLAYSKCHELSKPYIGNLIKVIRHSLPAACRGSNEAIDAWVAHSGVQGWVTVDAAMYRLHDGQRERVAYLKQISHFKAFE